jgi:hypothetical membrane protein
MAFITATFAALLLLAGIIYFGKKKPGYSHLKHSISELGETGSPIKKSINYWLFLPAGILLLDAALFSYQQQRTNAAGLAACMGAGYVIAAFFPCDAGSPVAGSWRQHIHNLGGLIEYGGAIYFINKAGQQGWHIGNLNFKVIAIWLLVCLIITAIPKNPIRGLAQRFAEAWMFVCLLYMLYPR